MGTREPDEPVSSIVRSVFAAPDSFLLDAPAGWRHPGNLPYCWAEGLVLFGLDPVETYAAHAADGLVGIKGHVDRITESLQRTNAAIAVGFLSYDAGCYDEPSVLSSHPAEPTPLLYFGFYDAYYSCDPGSGKVIRHTVSGESEPATLLGANRQGPPVRPKAAAVPAAFRPNFTRRQYMTAVEAAREYIFAGDIYEVNLSQRFNGLRPDNMEDIYLRLRSRNPAPYAAAVRAGETTLMSSSPELFLRVEGGQVITRPIKGTIKRAADRRKDRAAAGTLMRSEKDNAELAMIIDLERNDLGRVSTYGSVKVLERTRVETFARVHHLVSTVGGRLRPGATLGELFAATFPGGSITGAPKIRAMQIIDELEPCRRGVYTGSIGYVLPGGRAEFNIAIRTIVCHGETMAVQVGGAVTADSDPEAEYEETLAKASGVLDSVFPAWTPATIRSAT